MGNEPKSTHAQKNDRSNREAKLTTRSSVLSRHKNEKRQSMPFQKADLISRKHKSKPRNKHNTFPKPGAKFPLDSERTVLAVLDQDAFLQKASAGFRLFVRTLNDQLLDNCLKNPHLNTLKRAIPPNLRYIYILRNAWKSLTEFERFDWEHCAKFSKGNYVQTCVSTQKQHLDKVFSDRLLDENRREHRNWLSTLNIEHLPCPLCSMQNKKRFRLSQLMSHLTLSHSTLHIYACHFCNFAFTSIFSLREHGICDCKQFGEFMAEIEGRTEKQMIFDFAYVSLFCAECGLQLILSSSCPPDVLAETLLHIMLTHSNANMLVCVTFSSVELQSSNIKVRFVNPILSEMPTSLICGEESDADNSRKFGFWSNTLELEEHHASKHERVTHKCTHCMTTFYTMQLLRYHQLIEHVMIKDNNKNCFLTSLFLQNAALIPAALDDNNTVLIGQSNCRRIACDPSALCWTPIEQRQKSTNDMRKIKGKTAKRRIRYLNINARENKNFINIKNKDGLLQKQQDTKTTQQNQIISERFKDDEDTQQQQNINSTLTFANWQLQMRAHQQKIKTLFADKHAFREFFIELNLTVAYTETAIVQNPLNDAVFSENISFCSNCSTLLVGDKQTQVHNANCCSNIQQLHAPKIKLLFDAKHSFPFARISCPFCTREDNHSESSVSHCSIQALFIHLTQQHGIICNVVGNIDISIRQCAEELLTRNWLNTDFDNELLRRINSTQLPKCTSELDAAIMAEQYSQTNLDRFSLLSPNNMDQQLLQSTSMSLLDCKNEPMDESYNDSFDTADVIHNNFPTNFVVVKREFTDDVDVNSNMSFAGSGISKHFDTSNFIIQDRGESVCTTPSKINVTSTSSDNNSPDSEKTMQSGFSNQSNDLRKIIIRKGEHVQRLISLSSTHLRNVNSTGAASKSHFVCFMCTFPERPSREAFGIHLLTHPDCEHWNTCCICSHNNTAENKHSNTGVNHQEHFEHPIQFFKHFEENHMLITADRIKCLYCGHMVLRNMPEGKAAALMFRHMVYECVKTDFCMLCGKLFKQHSAQLPALQLTAHRLREHRLIFDRFVCSSCKCGFYSREKFIKHRCKPAYRCVCNPSYRFNSWSEFSMHSNKNMKHLDDHTDTKSHVLMESRLEDDEQRRRYLLNDEYQREVRERIKQRQEIASKAKNTNNFHSGCTISTNRVELQTQHPKQNTNNGINNTEANNINNFDIDRDATDTVHTKKLLVKSVKINNAKITNDNNNKRSHKTLQWRTLNDDTRLPPKFPRTENDIDTEVKKLVDTMCLHVSEEMDNSISSSIENVIKKGMDERTIELDINNKRCVASEDQTNKIDGKRSNLCFSILPEHNNLNEKNNNNLLPEKQELKGVFSCNKCFLIFHTHVALEQHHTMAHVNNTKYFSLPLDTNTWLCRQCCVAFHDAHRFFVHMKEHQNNLMACRHCSGVTNESDYYLHKLQHPKDFICSICLLRYRNEIQLAQHLVKSHSKTLAFFCKICSFCNTSLYMVLQHMFSKNENLNLCFLKFNSDQLIIDYLGVTDAAQLRFLPNHIKWSEEKNKNIKFVKATECHHHCLKAFNGPALITCNDCFCLISLNAWKDTCYPKDAPEFNYIDHCRLVDHEESDNECVANTVHRMFLMEMEKHKNDAKLKYIDHRLRQEIQTATKKLIQGPKKTERNNIYGNSNTASPSFHTQPEHHHRPSSVIIKQNQQQRLLPPVLMPRRQIIQPKESSTDLPQQYSPPPQLTAAIPSKTMTPSQTKSISKLLPPVSPQISSTRLQQQEIYRYTSSSIAHSSITRITTTPNQEYWKRMDECPKTTTTTASIQRHLLQQRRQFPVPNPRIISTYRSNISPIHRVPIGSTNLPMYRHRPSPQPHQQTHLAVNFFSSGRRTESSPIRYSRLFNNIDAKQQLEISEPRTSTRI